MENPERPLSIKGQRAKEIIDEMESRAGIFKTTLKHEEYNIYNLRTALDNLKESIEKYADFINGFQVMDFFIEFHEMRNQYERIITMLNYEHIWNEATHGSEYRNDEVVQRLLAIINDFDRSINAKMRSLLSENDGEHQEGGRRRRRATRRRRLTRKRKSTHKKRKTHRRR